MQLVIFVFKELFIKKISHSLILYSIHGSKSDLDIFFPRNVESTKKIFYLKLARAIFADFAVITRMCQQT